MMNSPVGTYYILKALAANLNPWAIHHTSKCKKINHKMCAEIRQHLWFEKRLNFKVFIAPFIKVKKEAVELAPTRGTVRV